MTGLILTRNEKEMLVRLKRMKHPCLFGAGKIANRMLEFCFANDICIKFIIVSERKGNPLNLQGVPVILRDDIADENAKELEVIVALSDKSVKWIDIFINHNFKSVEFLRTDFVKDLYYFHRKIENVGKRGFETRKMYVDMNMPYAEPGQYSVIDKEIGEPVCRVCKDLDMEHIMFLYNIIDEGGISNIFNNLGHVPYKGTRGFSKNDADDIEIYIMTTEQDGLIPSLHNDRIYYPLQVGAKLAESKKDCNHDDEGENISVKNRNYSECTGLYWIWKNTRGQQYIGLEHYRRHLGLDMDSIEYIMKNDVDFIVALPQFTSKTVKDFFMTYLSKFDWDVFKKIVLEISPNTMETFEIFENGHFYLPCNVGIWKRTWFEKYCEFAFKIAFKIEEVFSKMHIYREDRYMGYFFECMHTIFVMDNSKKMKTAFADIEYEQV